MHTITSKNIIFKTQKSTAKFFSKKLEKGIIQRIYYKYYDFKYEVLDYQMKNYTVLLETTIINNLYAYYLVYFHFCETGW